MISLKIYNKHVVTNSVINKVSNPKVLIVTPSEYESSHMKTTKRVFKLFGVKSNRLISNFEDSNLYNKVCVKDICYFANKQNYSVILNYYSFNTVNDIVNYTILPTIHVSNNDNELIIGNPVVTFTEDSSINAAIFVIKILSFFPGNLDF